MKKQALKWSVLVLLILLGITANAGAIIVNVDDNLTDNMMITAGQTVTGSFDINPPVLPSDGNYNTPYDITTASAAFTFTDDGDTAFSHSNTTTTYTNWGTHNGTQYQVQTTYDYFVDANEQVQLAVGAQVSTDGTTWYALTELDHQTSSTSTSSHDHSYTYSCGTFGWSTCTGYYTHYVTTNYVATNYDSTSGYTGQLSIEVLFDAANMADLAMDGRIDFTIAGANGDIVYNTGLLTADVNPNPVTSSVPEPATVLLMFTGLAGLIGLGRGKKA